MEDKEKKQGLRLLHSLPEEEPNIWGMNPAELRDYLDRLYALRKDLDSREPGDEESEEYDDWADAHHIYYTTLSGFRPVADPTNFHIFSYGISHLEKRNHVR